MLLSGILVELLRRIVVESCSCVFFFCGVVELYMCVVVEL